MSKDDHVAQLAECSHGKRQALGSSPARAMIFLSCDILQFRALFAFVPSLPCHRHWTQHKHKIRSDVDSLMMMIMI